MAFFFVYVLAPGLTIASSVFIYFLFKLLKSNTTTPTSSNDNLPPGKTGWPIIGETIEFARLAKKGCPETFTQSRMSKYSTDVFRTSLMGEKTAVLCGSSGNKFLFLDKSFKSWWPKSLKQALMFPSNITNSSDVDESTKTRIFLNEFLRPDTLQHYAGIMDSMAKEHIELHWAPYKQVKAFPLTRMYTFASACRLFLDPSSCDYQKMIAELAEPFEQVTAGLMSVPMNIPGSAFSRAIRSGEIIREELLGIVRERKRRLVERMKEDEKSRRDLELDLLARMLTTRDGEFMDEKDVVNKVFGLLIASYDTTSTSIAFALKSLADAHPHVYNNVLREQLEIANSKGPGELLNWADIQRMKYTWNVVCESMRLNPPAQGTFREAITDVNYAGFTIPKGWKAYWTVHSTHKNPQYFPDPTRFDPSRFEGSGPPAFTFVPFGGGPRICPGKEYARMKILVFLHNVVTRFKLIMKQAVNPLDENIVYTPSPTPLNGLPIWLQPLDEL